MLFVKDCSLRSEAATEASAAPRISPASKRKLRESAARAHHTICARCSGQHSAPPDLDEHGSGGEEGGIGGGGTSWQTPTKRRKVPVEEDREQEQDQDDLPTPELIRYPTPSACMGNGNGARLDVAVLDRLEEPDFRDVAGFIRTPFRRHARRPRVVPWSA